jgi:hypothetical protein
MAIRIHFWMNVPGAEPGEIVEKEYRHTVAVPGAAGPAVPDNQAATGTGGGTSP